MESISDYEHLVVGIVIISQYIVFLFFSSIHFVSSTNQENHVFFSVLILIHASPT